MPVKLPTQKRVFKGIWIPKEIWLNPELNPIEKLLIVEIDSLDNEDDKGCFASNEYFGNFFGVSEGTIANMISSLKKRDFIFQVFFDGRNRGLRVHENVKAGFTKKGTRVHENVKAGFTKRGKQVSRKRDHNNTVNNPSNNPESEGERTPPDPNPLNLQSQKNESGLVAPAEPLRLSKEQIDYLQSEARKEKAPPVAPTPPDEDEDAFAQWLPSLHTAMENNAPGAMPMPTHIVTETTDDPNIRITTGVNLSEPVTKTITFPQNTPRPLRYDEYPNPRNANELKDRLKEYFTHHPEDWRLLIENAKVNWMPEKLEETTLAYCLHQEKEGNMKRTYNTYKAGLTTWFMRQKSWDAQNNAPKEGGQTRQNPPANYTSQTRH